MSFSCKSLRVDSSSCKRSFVDYNEARAYRSENDGMLRPTQWSDIIVKVYV